MTYIPRLWRSPIACALLSIPQSMHRGYALNGFGAEAVLHFGFCLFLPFAQREISTSFESFIL